jgi:hypothetical protein
VLRRALRGPGGGGCSGDEGLAARDSKGGSIAKRPKKVPFNLYPSLLISEILSALPFFGGETSTLLLAS